MKSQIEIVSYLLFVVLVIIISSFLISYFWFIGSRISRDINKLNLYSFLNIFESPIIIFNSVCNFCKVNYLLWINYSLPSNSLFLVSNHSFSKIKYEELYSSAIIYSNLLNYPLIFFIDISAHSARKIYFELNTFENKIVVKNI